MEGSELKAWVVDSFWSELHVEWENYQGDEGDEGSGKRD